MLVVASSSGAQQRWASQAVVSGLDNPRGLAFAPDGSLYVTEAGRPETPGADTPSVEVRGSPLYYGTSGAITRWDGAAQSRVLTGLPTLYNLTTGEMTGPQGIGFSGDGDMYFTTGLGTDPAQRVGPELNRLGLLMRVPSGGATPEVVSDVSAYEGDENPAGGPIDSNPFQIEVQTSGVLVADAGANALLNVHFDGSIELVSTFASLPSGADPVPTSVATGGGDVYVSQLTGFPFTPGSAGVFRVDDAGLTLVGGGFTNVIDLEYGPDGMLYVLELSHAGLLSGDLTGGLWRLDPTTGDADLLMTEELLAPTALAFDDDGMLYIANRGLMPGQGEVLAFTPVPEPEVMGAIAAVALIGVVFWRKRRTMSRTVEIATA
jgi:sugar lactone lactonase YvrE